MAPRAAAAAADDMLDEDMDWTDDLPVPVKRRVQALREVQAQYDKLMREFIKERATLAAKYETAAGGCGQEASAAPLTLRYITEWHTCWLTCWVPN